MKHQSIWEYFRMVSIVKQVDHAVEISVDGVAKANWDNIYQRVREGYAGVYTKKDTDAWTEVMTKYSVLDQLKKVIEFETEGNTWVKKMIKGMSFFH
jgi:hypothetical protein